MISAVLARPSAGIGVVKVLFELALGSCLVVRTPAPGTRDRFPPGPRAGFASCTEQLA